MLQGNENNRVDEGCQENILEKIFNNSQHVRTADSALNQLKKVHRNMEFSEFERQFKHCLKKLLQSKQTIYFKTSCDFVCKFLQYLSQSNDPKKRAKENTKVQPKSPKRKRTTKRKDISDDELVGGFLSMRETVTGSDSYDDDEPTPKRRRSAASQQSFSIAITDQDRIVSSCIDVADHYMQVVDEDCRLNAVFFVCKFLSHVDSLDEEICTALKSTLPRRIRDRKPIIRAQAVLASRTFQDHKMIQDAFAHHFQRDPELVVRKALMQIMDIKIFGPNFIVDSTRDNHEAMRKAAFQRLGKISPHDLTSKQLHCVVHNGLNERERQASYYFKTHLLEPWFSILYDGIDLHKLLEPFDVVNNYDDVCRLLEMIYERDLDKIENNGTSTKLHQVVESFRERWLNSDNSCLPMVNQIDERIATIWLTLARFCKKNQSIIKSVKVRTVLPPTDPNESIAQILDIQERDDDVAELFERLTPDLVNLVDFLKRFVHYSDQVMKKNIAESTRLEFIYQYLMDHVSTYEIGDELERKTVQEVLGTILKENLLTGRFSDFISPIVKCLFKLIYSSSPGLMINYISELINNVRSHLEDLISSTQQTQINILSHSTIAAPSKAIKSAKKVKINEPIRNSYAPDLDPQSLETKIANVRVDIEDYKDKLEDCIKAKDFDSAKTINNKIGELQAELALLHGRRCSIASDVSHMSVVLESELSGNCKLSSTMIGDTSITENQSDTSHNKDDRIFKHHTNELIKCLQMYFGCLQVVKITEVPQTMLNHLTHLSYECLDEWFREDSRVRSLMVACNGLTALIDRKFANEPTTVTLLVAACFDSESIEIRSTGFKSLVDVMCQHEDLNVPIDKVEKFLHNSLRDYGKYNPDDIEKSELKFITLIVEGTTKLYYFRKLSSPEILSHLILWWYHPRTHSKLKQFIGVFLPAFVDDTLRRQKSAEDIWLKELLEQTFVTSIEYLHSYILGPGFNIMSSNDMNSMVSFLCNLIPISFHSSISNLVDMRMDDLSDNCPDLVKYFTMSKAKLSCNVQGEKQDAPEV